MLAGSTESKSYPSSSKTYGRYVPDKTINIRYILNCLPYHFDLKIGEKPKQATQRESVVAEIQKSIGDRKERHRETWS